MGDGNRSFAFASTRSRREQVPPADGLLQGEDVLEEREPHSPGEEELWASEEELGEQVGTVIQSVPEEAWPPGTDQQGPFRNAQAGGEARGRSPHGTSVQSRVGGARKSAPGSLTEQSGKQQKRSSGTKQGKLRFS